MIIEEFIAPHVVLAIVCALGWLSIYQLKGRDWFGVAFVIAIAMLVAAVLLSLWVKPTGYSLTITVTAAGLTAFVGVLTRLNKEKN